MSGLFFAILFAILASDLVGANPIETGIPVHFHTVLIISLHFLSASSSVKPLNLKNASSIL